jgi:PAS domain S-box-containing protein
MAVVGTFGVDDFEIERMNTADVDALKIAVGLSGAISVRTLAVRESERIYRQAIQAAGAVPYYRNYGKNNYEFVGSEIEKMIGYKPEEVTVELMQNIMQENIPLGEGLGMPIDEAVNSARTGRFKIWRSDMRVIAKNGEEKWITDSAVELFDDSEFSYASVGIMQDVTDRKTTEAKLRKRESILEAITFSAEQFLKATDWRDRIEVVLERLGRELNASHAYLFEKHMSAEGVLLNSLRHEWTAPGQKSDMDNPAYQNAPVNDTDFRRYYEILGSGEPFVGNTAYFLESENEKAWMASTGIKALLEMRIVVDDRQWGTIGFDDMVNQREWTPMEVDVLRVAANVLGAAIKRQMVEAALQKELDERIRAEQALRSSEEKFSKAFQATQVMMTIEDGNHLFIDANKAFMEGFGFSRDDVVGHTAPELNIFYDPADVQRLRQELIQQGFLKDFETRFRRRSGEMGIVLLSSENFYVDNVQYTLTSGLDITERKLVEAERELIGDLEAKSTELERFTYTVSHDLKSPLVTINGFLGYLEQDAASGNMERLKKDTHRIQEAVNKMQRLLSELLELSRIGRMMNAPQITSFDGLVREAMDIVQGRLNERNVTVKIQPNLPAVFGDKPRLVEVMQNLLDNAAKYMGDQPEPRVEVGQRGMEHGKPYSGNASKST